MNPTTSNTALSLYYVFIGFLPFIGTIILYFVTKLLRFKRPSLKNSFYTILLSATSLVIVSVLIALLVHYVDALDGWQRNLSAFTVGAATFLTQTIAIKKFFGESTVKTITTSTLTSLGIFFFLALHPLVYLFFMEQPV